MLFLATLLLAIPQAQAPAATGTPATEITPAPDAPRLELEFTELNDSGISGTATLSAAGDQTIVELQLEDTGENHPAHIHAGTCDDLQPEFEFALANVRAEGVSSTVVDRPLQALIDGEFAIDVHLSPNELGTLVACVDIDGQPTVPASAGTPGPATPAVAGLATPTEVVVATETPFGSAASTLATAVLRAATSAIMTVAAEGTTVPPTPTAIPPTPTAVPPTPTTVPATLTPTATVATAEPTVPPATPTPFTAIGRTAVRAATSAIQAAVALVVVDGASPQTPIPPQTAVAVEPTPTTGPAAVLTPPAATQPPQPGTVIDESTPVVDDGTGGAISTAAAAETTPPPVAGAVITPPPAVAPTVVPPVAGAVAPTVPPTPQTPALGDGTQGGIDDSGKGVAITPPPVASAPIARDPGSSGASAPIVPAGVSGDGTQGDIADAGKGVPLSPTTGLPSAAGTGSSLDWPTTSSRSMPWLVGAMSVALLLAGAAIRSTGSRRSRSSDPLR